MNTAARQDDGIAILPGSAAGPIIVMTEPLSFWGGVDPATSTVIDIRHPSHGAALAGAAGLGHVARFGVTRDHQRIDRCRGLAIRRRHR